MIRRTMLRTKIPLARILACCILSMLACAELPTEGPLSTEERQVLSRARPQRVEAPEEAMLWTVDRTLPNFGGLFRDENGAINVWVTRPTPQRSADVAVRQAISQHGARPQPSRVILRDGQFRFDSLADWRDRLSEAVFLVPGVISLDLDERANRIAIGIGDQVAQPPVATELARLGIPESAVEIREEEPVAFLAAATAGAALQTAACDHLTSLCRPLWGGLQVGRIGSGCSLGYVGKIGGVPVAITASHCSEDMWTLEGTVLDQPTSPFDFSINPIGVESHDPDAPACGFLSPLNCRWSDASAFQLESGVEGAGRIARPSTKAVWPNATGSLTIDSQNPYFDISGPYGASVVVGDTVSKVGMVTGWTSGAITHTCKHFRFGFLWLNKARCQNFARLGADEGDSGAPFFLQRSDGTVALLGITMARTGDEIVYSPIGNIASDLGTVTDYWSVYNGPPPTIAVSISGPTLITAEGDYTWYASPSGGSPPYSYQWEVDYYDLGISYDLGSEQSQSIYVTESGNFRLDVIISDGTLPGTSFLYVQNAIGGGGGWERPIAPTSKFGSEPRISKSGAGAPK